MDELSTLKARIAELERAQSSRARNSRMRGALLMGAAVLVLLGGVAWAADGNCPNGLPHCFVANQPAMAADVNENFATVKQWIEQKVGPVTAPAITATGTLNGVASTTFFETGYLGGCQVLFNFRDPTALNVLIDANIYLDSNCTQLVTKNGDSHAFCARNLFRNDDGSAACSGVYPYYTNGLVQALRIK